MRIGVKMPRKKDKRSIETEENIKRCLLEFLATKRFGGITVSETCRAAGITRATFYQHYDNLADVLDELIDDVTNDLGDIPLAMCESCAPRSGAPVEPHAWSGMPFCHFYASQNPYRALLEEGWIAERLIEHIVDSKLDDMLLAYSDGRQWTSEERTRMRYFNIFRMNGCLAAVRAAFRNGYDWSLVQPGLDSAMAAAMETVMQA